MGLRLATFVGTGLIFLSTTRNEELTNGLIRMGCPYPIAFALSTALRLVPTFAGAGATIIQAQVSRGLDLESGNIFSRVGKFIPQAVPLFIYAIRHTNLLAMALESKGFSPESKRTMYYEPQHARNRLYGARPSHVDPWIITVYSTGITPRCYHPRSFVVQSISIRNDGMFESWNNEL